MHLWPLDDPALYKYYCYYYCYYYYYWFTAK